MKLRTTVLTLLAGAMPAIAQAQARTAADYMAAIEGKQSAP